MPSGRPKKNRSGVLSKDDKIYIAEHFLSRDPEFIAGFIKKSLRMVNLYIDKLQSNKKKPKKAKDKTLEEDFKIEKVNPTEQTGTATTMTENGASIPIRLNKGKDKNPFSTR